MEKTMDKKLNEIMNDNPILKQVAEGTEVFWTNPKIEQFDSVKDSLPIGMEDIKDAEARLQRFAPLIMKLFPETQKRNGIIESDLIEIPNMWDSLVRDSISGAPDHQTERTERIEQDASGSDFGRLFLKMDSDLDVAGSVKARGGIYEVLKHTEELAIENGLPSGEFPREFFSKYKIQVGSTGNLGMSIGIMSAALGYQAIVHMSCDAKQWKKDYLREHGVTVIEYEGDYGEAVAQGRAESDADPMSYFVDDENSKDLFMGYAVAALRLKGQLEEKGIVVDEDHPLIVYIPCGVGGAPGGIAFGLKEVYGDNAYVYFVEPTEAPCMLVGLATGLHNEVSVQDIGLSGQTHADGLAVSRPSGFVGEIMEQLLSGEMTVVDSKLYDYLRMLRNTEGIFIEPSSCAGFQGPVALMNAAGKCRANAEKDSCLPDVMNDTTRIKEKLPGATHIVWATGGRLVPQDVREEFYNTYLR